MRLTDWNGYETAEFEYEGREALLVLPKAFAEGRPWIWRAEFFGAFASADLAMLEQGYAVAYYRISDMYGCPAAIEAMESFHRFAVRLFGLAEKTILFGFSRGGLYSFNYAATYPERVAALYLDAPVLDIRSWPGGKGAGTFSPKEWEECLASYGLTEEEALEAPVSPLHRIEPVAAARIPILVVAGADDIPVPYAENGKLLEERYRALGGDIETIVKPGVGHHPHSLEDPTPIVAFLLSRTKPDGK